MPYMKEDVIHEILYNSAIYLRMNISRSKILLLSCTSTSRIFLAHISTFKAIVVEHYFHQKLLV